MKDNRECYLMKGNEAIAHAAIRCGCDGYFGYPITPQSEVLETLSLLKPWETTGMVVLQAESEVAAINMLYGGGASGKRVMTSSSSPGVALMQEGISYMTAVEIPAVIVNVQRGGPGLGTIQPGQADYFQATIGGGNGDYNTLVLAPASVQDMADFVDLAFNLAFKYRNPTFILSDGVIGQMMALEMDPRTMEQRNIKLQEKYALMRSTEQRSSEFMCEDAEYLFIAFGSVSRCAEEAVTILREKGHKVGLLRPITLWPFPEDRLNSILPTVKKILVCEMNAGQMINDVKLAINCQRPVCHYGRTGGVVPTPEELLESMLQIIEGKD